MVVIQRKAGEEQSKDAAIAKLVVPQEYVEGVASAVQADYCNHLGVSLQSQAQTPSAQHCGQPSLQQVRSNVSFVHEEGGNIAWKVVCNEKRTVMSLSQDTAEGFWIG